MPNALSNAQYTRCKMDHPKSTLDSEPETNLNNDPSTSTRIDHIASTVSTASTVSVNDLPDEILDYIFSFLDLAQRIRIEAVCKRWHQVGRCPTQVTFDNDFVENRTVDDNVLSSFLTRCGSSLKKLVLYPIPELTGNSLTKIGVYCPKLESMELHLVDMHQVACLKIIAPSCPNLKMIVLQIHINNSEEDVREIEDDGDNNGGNNQASNSPDINNGDDNNNGGGVFNENDAHHFTISVHQEHQEQTENQENNPNTAADDNEAEEESDEEGKTLENFLKNCNDMYNDGLLAIAQTCKSVEYLHVISLWSVALSWLSAINPNIHTFILENTGFTAEGMQCLMDRCHALQSFTLESCRQLNQPGLFRLLRHYRHTLTILKIKYAFDWFLSWGSTLKDLVNLEVLDLVFCDHVDDELMEHLGRSCVKLRYLDLSGTDVTDTGLLALRRLPSLKELIITYPSAGVTGHGLELLVEHGVLQQVTVSPFGSMEDICTKLARLHPNVHCIVEN